MDHDHTDDPSSSTSDHGDRPPIASPVRTDDRSGEPAADRALGVAGPLTLAAFASIGAGLVHAAAVGAHDEHTQLARIFVAFAVAQIGVGVLGLLRSGRAAAAALAAVNVVAFAGWIVTRFVGISAIDGLGTAEDPQLSDTLAALLAAAAVLGVALPAARRPSWRPGSGALTAAALLVIAMTVPAMAGATSHSHDHGDEVAADDHAHADGAHAADDHHDAPVAAGDGAAAADDHAHDDEDPHAAAGDANGTADDHHDDADHHTDDHDDAGDADDADAWPRPWDPTGPIDFSGVPGVTAEQQARAEQLVADTLATLPQFADVTTIGALGYRSIGDSSTGFEHFINRSLIGDDRFLDPAFPESLVYRVDGDAPEARTLVSAMFIATSTPIDDPQLVDFGGPLMQWHVHTNLCWGLGEDGTPKVMAVTDDHGGTCPAGTVNAGGDNPMVHVWIAPHPCGPFAALEGHGAGQADAGDGTRTDQCAHDHGHDETSTATTPYDPTMPIDLGGIEGVTPQQQAFAENLVAATLRDLPQWADPAVAEAAGFRSIGDGLTGHEHYIQWDWIDDDVWLDPDFPESLVFEPQPDGSKKLVSAMFMLPTTIPLDEVPDWGGKLMQWHIHDDLCFTDDPVAPRVAGVTSAGGTCRAPLVKLAPSPMIHVWITSNPCGPFAALEGVGAGQVREGEERWCDTAHGH